MWISEAGTILRWFSGAYLVRSSGHILLSLLPISGWVNRSLISWLSFCAVRLFDKHFQYSNLVNIYNKFCVKRYLFYILLYEITWKYLRLYRCLLIFQKFNLNNLVILENLYIPKIYSFMVLPHTLLDIGTFNNYV
jgi:hypothetical protein